MAIGIGRSWSVGATARRWLERAVPWRRAAVDLLFPPRCALCDADLVDTEDGLLLCGSCQGGLAPQEWLGCPRCGDAAPPNIRHGRTCHTCRGMRLHFDTVVPLGSYHGPLKQVVLKMKRASGDPLSAAMGQFFVRRRGAQIASFRPDVVIPVPMHWRRRWVRRTNSPDLLAEALGRFLRVRVLDRALRCCRNTPPQKDLKPMQRFANVRDAFRLAAGHDLRGARVLLVDDVLTTGATCSEAAKLVKCRAGVETVVVAVLAR